jgi:hypothetical protein
MRLPVWIVEGSLGGIIMLDFLMIAAGVGFFVVAILYVIACEKM